MFLLVFFFLFFMAFIPSHVSSQPILEETFPSPNSVLKEPLDNISLTFSEPIRLESSSIQLFTEKGDSVLGELVCTELTKLVLFVPNLDEGKYKVQWEVTFYNEHTMNGSHHFSIQSTTEQVSQQVPSQTSLSVIKIVELFAFVVLIGLYFFIHWLADKNTSPLLLHPFSKKIEVSIYSFIFFLYFVKSFQVFIPHLTIDSWLTFVPMLRPLFVAGFLFFIIRNFHKSFALIMVILLLFTFSLTSHSFSVNQTLSHSVHLVAASVWVGGLLSLLVYSFTREPSYVRMQLIHKCIQRFFIVSFILFVVVIFSGLIMSFTYIESVNLLTTTPYGKWLLAKLIVTVMILLITCFHTFVWVPLLRDSVNFSDKHNHLRKLLFLLRIEFVFLLILVILSGFLSTTTTPDKTELHWNDHEHRHHNH